MRGGMRRGSCEDARVRVGRGGKFQLMVGGCGERIRGPDTGGGRRRRVCGCAAWVARVRGLRLARVCCEVGGGVSRGLRVCRYGGCGRAQIAAAGKGGSAAAWAERCGWIGCGLGLGFVWLVGGGACAGGGTGALVGDSACDAGAPACGGRWIVACALCSLYAAPLRLAVLLGDFSGAGLSFEGAGGCEAGCAVGAVRTRGCGWGSAGRAVLADGWRMWGADTEVRFWQWSRRIALVGFRTDGSRWDTRPLGLRRPV
jgi:hypothetical protein